MVRAVSACCVHTYNYLKAKLMNKEVSFGLCRAWGSFVNLASFLTSSLTVTSISEKLHVSEGIMQGHRLSVNDRVMICSSRGSWVEYHGSPMKNDTSIKGSHRRGHGHVLRATPLSLSGLTVQVAVLTMFSQ